MLLITDLNEVPSLSKPCGLTIGSFDGVHLGHQALLQHLTSKLPTNGKVAVFTFSNHPTHLFTPERPVPLICPPLQKVKHLADCGVDFVILIPFTREFSKTPFREFLSHLKKQLNFSYLTLGMGASFGKDKEGVEANVRKIAAELSFAVDYLPKTVVGKDPVSSGRVRTAIAKADFHEAQNCLGRPYSLMGRLTEENGLLQFSLAGICLPPEGIYPVRIKIHDITHLGRAHVMPQNHIIRLDPLNTSTPLYNKDVEVIF
jgi:riboflavin kinase / FMN adenylyltransferase